MSTSNLARSRLAHSLEVSCAGRTLGNTLGVYLSGNGVKINPYYPGMIVSSGCLAHDIGNPPFGHSGEYAIQHWMSNNITALPLDDWEMSDLLNYEGNAQGFRILTRLENWQRAGGLRLTISTIASFIKYPSSSLKNNSKKKFGFFKEDYPSFKQLYTQLNFKENGEKSYPRYPLTYLSEAADDICYAIIDMEDAYHLDLISFADYYDLLMPIASRNKGFSDKKDYDREIRIARLRSAAINVLIEQSMAVYISNIENIQSLNKIDSLINSIESNNEYKSIVNFSIENIYSTNRVLEIECAGFQAIGGLFDIFIPAVLDKSGSGKKNALCRKLIPEVYFKRINQYNDISWEKDIELNTYQQILSVCDYICGMTDSFAIELYQRLSGIKLPVY